MADSEVKNELKPCPFCGGEAKVVTTEYDAFVVCTYCGASGGHAYFERYAVSFWNSRYTEGTESMQSFEARLKEEESKLDFSGLREDDALSIFGSAYSEE